MHRRACSPGQWGRRGRFNGTQAGRKSKLALGTFAVTFFLATLAALEMDGVRLEDL